MSWIDDIKLALWGFNGAAPTSRASGVNFLEPGAVAVDNPNYLSTVDGQQVVGRTELTLPAPVPNLVWFAQAAPAVAADRWLGNYGAWQTSNAHSKCNTVAYKATRFRFVCTGGMPANDIVITLYVNLNPVVAWTMTLAASAGPTYQNSVSVPGGITIGNGGLVGIRATQAGTDPRPNWRAAFSLT